MNKNVLVNAEYTDELYYELKKLPQKYREVIHLYYYQDMPVDEIAKMLGKRSGTVRTQLNRAREILKKFMKEEDYV